MFNIQCNGLRRSHVSSLISDKTVFIFHSRFMWSKENLFNFIQLKRRRNKQYIYLTMSRRNTGTILGVQHKNNYKYSRQFPHSDNQQHLHEVSRNHPNNDSTKRNDKIFDTQGRGITSGGQRLCSRRSPISCNRQQRVLAVNISEG